jgi:hypothetical protein
MKKDSNIQDGDIMRAVFTSKKGKVRGILQLEFIYESCTAIAMRILARNLFIYMYQQGIYM